MLPPDEDIKDRIKVWEAMEIFWPDTDYKIRFKKTAAICASSKYSMSELEQIFFNEARPAFFSNLFSLAGEWAGFSQEWIINRVLKTHKFGRQKYWPALYYLPFFNGWSKLEKAVLELRRKQ